MFGDSSQDVYCAIGFLRARIIETQKTEIAFVFDKARVALRKVSSILKLELQAALLASRLEEDILQPI